jgi:ABC-type Mn2+/Zn2+ transport system permease subunit
MLKLVGVILALVILAAPAAAKAQQADTSVKIECSRLSLAD